MEQIYFGQRLTELRKARGMTQEGVAKRLGITNQAVSKWESDQCCPDIMQLPALADLFEISIDALFGREPVQTSAPEKEQTAQTVIHALPWEDNDDLHAVCYVGHRLMNYKNIPIMGGRRVSVSFSCLGFGNKTAGGPDSVVLDFSGMVNNIYSEFSVSCKDSEIGGSVQAGDSVTCDSVEGSVNAGDSVTCGNVGGNVEAGDSVYCGDVGGNVRAGDSVTCKAIYGSVKEVGDSVQCGGDIHGNVSACGDVHCGSIRGSACSGDEQ